MSSGATWTRPWESDWSMPFLTRLVVGELGGGRRWEVLEPLRYDGRVDSFTVPAGFRTDFASIPGFLQSLAPKLGSHNRAAVLHDWLYAAAPCVLRPGGGRHRISRADADGLFRRAMRESGVGRLRRWSFWASVRAAGWIPWRRYRRAEGVEGR